MRGAGELIQSFFMLSSRTRSLLWLTGVGAITAVAFFFHSRLFSRLLEQTTSNEVLFHVDTRERRIALTIDDGPHPDLTPQILDLLAEHDAPATFFLIGERIPGNESLLNRIVAEGHELGNHLMTDRASIKLEPDDFERQLADAHALISPYGPVRWFRPGSGWYNGPMLERIRPYNYRAVVGSVYPYDAQFSSTEFAASYILGNVQPGSIIVLHDGEDDRETTIETLRRILPALKKRGYQFQTLTELANEP
jgi:peptidoglycan-N-acetylglucosamine deacetylase